MSLEAREKNVNMPKRKADDSDGSGSSGALGGTGKQVSPDKALFNAFEKYITDGSDVIDRKDLDKALNQAGADPLQLPAWLACFISF